MFDPYHKWLGIPPEKQPANYYQLLGIQPEETDREVIEEAALRQSSHLRSYQLGPHAALCTKLLNEIAAAQAVLLNPAKRSAYDARLAQKQGVQSGPVAPKLGQGITSVKPAAAAARTIAGDDEDEVEKRPRRRHRHRDDDVVLRRDWFTTKVLVGVLVLLLIPFGMVGALYYVFVMRERAAPPAEIVANPMVMPNGAKPRAEEVAAPPPPVQPRPAPNQQPAQPPPIPPKEAAPAKPPQQIEGGWVLAENPQNLFRNPLLSPDGRWAAFTSGGDQVHFWDLGAKKEIGRGTARGAGATWAISANGQFVAVPGGDAFEVWNMQTGEKVKTVAHPQRIHSIALSPDGKTVVTGTGEIDVGPDGKQKLNNGVTAFKDCELRLWDVASGKMTRQWSAHETVVVHIHLTANRLYSQGAFGSVHEVDLTTGKEKRSKDNRVIRQNFSPDGSRLLGTLQDNRTLVVIDTSSRQILRQFASPDPTPQVRWSQNGKIALVTDTKNMITAWDVEQGLSLKTFAGPAVAQIAISGDGKLALVGGMGSVRVLNLD